jgi:hypothetical protein
MKVINNTANAIRFVVTQSGNATLSGAESAKAVVYSSGVSPNSAFEFGSKGAGDGAVVYITSADIGNRGHFRRKAANESSTISVTLVEE